MQRINRYPSPLTPLVNDGTGNISHGDYDVAIDNLEAGTYVFAADIQNSGTQTGINVMLFDSGWNPLFSSNKIGHVQTTFTLKKPDRVRIRPNQPGVTISNVIVERADTYALTSGGGSPGFLHQGHGSILTSRLVVGRENRESMAGPALRKPGQHLEFDTGSCHHSEGRRPLGIHPSQGLSLHPESEVRMHDDAAQPVQLMGLHAAGAGGYVAHGEWGVRLGHHQRRSKECCWHPCGCRCQDHGDWHVRRRSGRMVDTAGGGSARLRSRHRALLNDGLGVAA